MMKKKQREKDLFFMRKALFMAKKALIAGEVPVGAALVYQGQLIFATHNQKESLKRVTAHAEILALEKSDSWHTWRRLNCTLYVTLEPCIMCAGALIAARIKTLVYGCPDPKTGAIDSLYQILKDKRLNHQIEVRSGILATECSALLTDFFKQKRSKKAFSG